MFSRWHNIAVARFTMLTLMGLTWPFLLELEDKPPIELGDITKIGSLKNLYNERNLSWIEATKLMNIPRFHRLILLPHLLHPAQHQVGAVEGEYK
jgi:hypothetical protein